VKKVYLYGAIEIATNAIGIFKVTELRLKHYYVSEPMDGKVFYDLPNAASS